jgi:DNA-binding NtrC family response regulator
MTPEVQAKLLRVLQENEYVPLGSDSSQKSDVRIVVATNQDLAEMTATGLFRRDLYYRLSTHVLAIPPLRDRKEDLPVLLDHFIAMASEELNRKPPRCPNEVCEYLKAYSFPGNIRELRAIVFNAVATCRAGILSVEPFQEYVIAHGGQTILAAGAAEAVTQPERSFDEDGPFPTWDNAVKKLLERALERADGNQSMAARLLNLKRTTFIKRYDSYVGSD